MMFCCCVLVVSAVFLDCYKDPWPFTCACVSCRTLTPGSRAFHRLTREQQRRRQAQYERQEYRQEQAKQTTTHKKVKKEKGSTKNGKGGDGKGRARGRKHTSTKSDESIHMLTPAATQAPTTSTTAAHVRASSLPVSSSSLQSWSSPVSVAIPSPPSFSVPVPASVLVPVPVSVPVPRSVPYFSFHADPIELD